MIFTLAAVTIGLATIVSSITVGLLALLVRVLRAIDLDDGDGDSGGGRGGGAAETEPPADDPDREPPADDPDCFAEFESELAAYADWLSAR